MSNEVTSLPGYEIVISGGSVGEPDKMYGAMAKLLPDDGRIESAKGIPYTKEEKFRLWTVLVARLISGVGEIILFVKV
jgi:hypothetical protein